MKKTIIVTIATLFLAYSCSKDDDHSHSSATYEYTAHIHSPDTSDKHVGDTIHIHVDLNSGTNETVHHVNVTIKNKIDGTVIYNKPDDAHVHATTGKHEHHDDFVLSTVNGVSGHTDWIIEAKVWGHTSGDQEVTSSKEFHVHP